MPASRNPTVSDVARAAAVSKATAARVLAGYGKVSPQLAARVLASAEALDYRVDELARTMTTGRSGTIAVVVGDIRDRISASIVSGIVETAKDAGYAVLLSNADDDIEKECVAVAMGWARRVDGLIVVPADQETDEHLVDLVVRGLPVVLVDRPTREGALDAALVNHEAGARLAVRRLLDMGHRRLAHLTSIEPNALHSGGASWIARTVETQRIDGVVAEAIQADLLEPHRLSHPGAGSAEAVEAITSELMRRNDRPTAILLSDGRFAPAVLRAAATYDFSVPHDLSLVALDDTPLVSVLSPAVTALAQPSRELGVEAMRMLLERLGGRTVVRRALLLPVLIERASVGPPASKWSGSPPQSA